jgi:hypothetical protein
MSKRRRAFSNKGLEIRAADFWGDSGGASLHERKPNEDVFDLLTLTIGMTGERGASLFYTTIATPEALKARAPEDPTVMFSRAVMIVSEYDWHTIDAGLKVILKACEAPTWSEATERLLRYFTWEYEDAHHPSVDRVIVQSKSLKITSANVADDRGPVSLRGQRPNEEVDYLLTLTIGMAGEASTDFFCTRIATPEALKARAPRMPTVMSTRALMVVSAFDWRTIDERLKQILKDCEAPTWSDAKQRLLRSFS